MIKEASVGRLDRFLRDIAEDCPSAAKGAQVVLGQMFALAIRHGVIPTNPVRDTGRLRDLDLAAERPTLTICGTLVFVTEERASSDNGGPRATPATGWSSVGGQ